jgi:HSP20 family protein
MKPEFPKRATGHWVPSTDVYSTDTGLVIKVELAGMRSEHLEITVEGNRIRISGDRPDTCRPQKASFLVMEINYGPFESVLELPNGYDLSQARASYLNGFLRIDVPPGAPPPSAPPPLPPPLPLPQVTKPQGPTPGGKIAIECPDRPKG